MSLDSNRQRGRQSTNIRPSQAIHPYLVAVTDLSYSRWTLKIPPHISSEPWLVLAALRKPLSLQGLSGSPSPAALPLPRLACLGIHHVVLEQHLPERGQLCVFDTLERRERDLRASLENKQCCLLRREVADTTRVESSKHEKGTTRSCEEVHTCPVPGSAPRTEPTDSRISSASARRPVDASCIAIPT